MSITRWPDGLDAVVTDLLAMTTAELHTYEAENGYPALCDLVAERARQQYRHNKTNGDRMLAYVRETRGWDDERCAQAQERLNAAGVALLALVTLFDDRAYSEEAA